MDSKVAHPPAVLRWIMPSLSQWLWLVILAVLLATPWRVAMVSSDGDACMHWAVGKEMLRTGHIVRADTFSNTKLGAPVISKEWLSEILFALAGRVGRFDGLAALAALLIATTFALLHRQLLRAGVDLITASIFTILAAWAASIHWLARPHAFSFLLMLFWNDAIRRCNDNRLALILGALSMLWVNLHGAFLAGFFVLGAYWLGACIERDRPRIYQLTLAGIIAGLASLANPNGWQLHAHSLAFLRSPLTETLAEYSSCNFNNLRAIGFLVWLGVTFLTLALCRPSLRAGDALLLLSWSYFALYAARNIPLLVIVAAPILAPPVSAAVRGQWAGLTERLRETDAAARGWWLVGLLGVACIMWRPHPALMPPDKWPVAAVDHIRKNPEDFNGRMFNQYIWGGYLMLTMPEHKTFVDGRTDFYGEPVVNDFYAVTDLGPKWLETLQRREVTWTLLPAEHRVNLGLALLPGWREVYRDAVSAIYCKKP